MSSSSGLQGVKWDLVSIVLNGRPVSGVGGARANITLGPDLRAASRGGCNRFFGSYALDGGHIKFGNLASTRMSCDETMEVEDAFFKALAGVGTALLADDHLEMRSEDGATVLTFQQGTCEPSP
jgi:heat shock protein HslJ